MTEKYFQQSESSLQLPRDSDGNFIHIGDSVFLTWNKEVFKVASIEFCENNRVYLHGTNGIILRVDDCIKYDLDMALYIINQEED